MPGASLSEQSSQTCRKAPAFAASAAAAAAAAAGTHMPAITLMQVSIHSHFLTMDPPVRRGNESNDSAVSICPSLRAWPS